MMLITTTNELENFCKTLEDAPFCAVDTEFLRETTYWPKLCLIQIATKNSAVLIDPLSSNLSLEPFFRIMKSEKIVKVFHAARQDIEIIYHLSGIIPAPLFDTQIAAMVCGYGASISYEQMIYQLLKIQIDKSPQYTNWMQRPLTESQKRYALADVIHLCDAYLPLKEHLERQNRKHWIQEEMHILSSPKTYSPAPEEAWKRVKGKVYKPIELCLLKKLANWRDKKAQERNVPRRHVLKDETLIEISIQKPKAPTEFMQLRSLGKNHISTDEISELLCLVQETLKTPKEQLPKIEKPRPPSETVKAGTELLKILLKLISEKHKIAPKLLATTEELSKLASEGKRADILAMHGWRYEIFGKEAIALLDGQRAFAFKNNKLAILDITGAGAQESLSP